MLIWRTTLKKCDYSLSNSVFYLLVRKLSLAAEGLNSNVDRNTSGVILGKLLNFCVSQFPYLWNGENNDKHLPSRVVSLEKIIFVKIFAQVPSHVVGTNSTITCYYYYCCCYNSDSSRNTLPLTWLLRDLGILVLTLLCQSWLPTFGLSLYLKSWFLVLPFWHSDSIP